MGQARHLHTSEKFNPRSGITPHSPTSTHLIMPCGGFYSGRSRRCHCRDSPPQGTPSLCLVSIVLHSDTPLLFHSVGFPSFCHRPMWSRWTAEPILTTPSWGNMELQSALIYRGEMEATKEKRQLHTFFSAEAPIHTATGSLCRHSPQYSSFFPDR